MCLHTETVAKSNEDLMSAFSREPQYKGGSRLLHVHSVYCKGVEESIHLDRDIFVVDYIVSSSTCQV